MITEAEFIMKMDQILDTARDQVVDLIHDSFYRPPAAQAASIKAAEPPASLPPATGFKWGSKSAHELQGVKPELVQCATIALTRFTTQDFMCYDGIRTIEEQKSYVAKGTSKTMQSKHLDGLAVDLVPVVGGVPKWDWDLIYHVAKAMWQAANYLGTANHIRWGGAWDRVLSDFSSHEDFQRVVVDYIERHSGKDFIDGPHFEWVG